ncbi:hypothetical protein C5167_029454 [Papaver somniferum]|nr:hypothetical protein C5167_029454 [Papaver somniferum]
MPPVCSLLVRPGRPAEEAPGIAKQQSDVILSLSLLLKTVHEPVNKEETYSELHSFRIDMQCSEEVYLDRP